MTDPPTITLANPADADKFYVGQSAVLTFRSPWWKRLLWWLRILRRPAPVTFTVAEVDYDNGAIVVD